MTTSFGKNVNQNYNQLLQLKQLHQQKQKQKQPQPQPQLIIPPSFKGQHSLGTKTPNKTRTTPYSQNPEIWGWFAWTTYEGLTEFKEFQGDVAKQTILLLAKELTCLQCKINFNLYLKEIKPLQPSDLKNNGSVFRWLRAARNDVKRRLGRKAVESPVIKPNTKEYLSAFFNYMYFLMAHYKPGEEIYYKQLIKIFVFLFSKSNVQELKKTARFLQLQFLTVPAQPSWSIESGTRAFWSTNTHSLWTHSVHLFEALFVVESNVRNLSLTPETRHKLFQERVQMVQKSFLVPEPEDKTDKVVAVTMTINKKPTDTLTGPRGNPMHCSASSCSRR
jgi:hypothetical protein